MPKVSIIMTVYNHEEFVNDAIGSILNQSFKNYELIIINDGSTDNTRQVVEQYMDCEKVLIKHIGHMGRAKALNIGFRMAKGDYIAVIDSDDIYLPGKIEKQVGYLDKHPDVLMVGTNAIEHDFIDYKTYVNRPPTDYEKIKKLLLYEAVLPFPTIMTRKHILEKVKFCSESLELKVDFDLIGKIASEGKIGVIPEELVIIRRHPKTSFRAFHPEKHRKTMLRVRWSNLWRLKPNFLQFNRILFWLSFEYCVHLFPQRIRQAIPNIVRSFMKESAARSRYLYSTKTVMGFSEDRRELQ